LIAFTASILNNKCDVGNASKGVNKLLLCKQQHIRSKSSWEIDEKQTFKAT